MSETSDHNGLASSAEQAAAWRVRLYADDATEADFLAFEDWIAAPGHREAYDRVEAADLAVEATRADLLNEINAKSDSVIAFPKDRSDERTQRPTRRVWLGGAIAAGLALFAVAPSLQQAMTPWKTYSSPAGETRNLTLEDGSRVTLNGASTIKVAFSSKERRVEMASAEASFDVTKDPQRPFVIGARTHEIRVVGTQFNVFNFDDATRVTVRRGIVQVRSGARAVRLPAGQEFSQKGVSPAVVRSVDPDPAFAWAEGRLIYDDVQLTEIVAALNRRFKSPVRLDGAKVGALRFSGVLTLDSEEAVVHRLEEFLPISSEFSGGVYILRLRNK